MKQVLKERDDVVFYLKMFPLPSHPQAFDKAKAVICELKNDNEKALKLLEDAYDRKQLPPPSCDTGAVDESIRTGQKLGVRSTPTMIFQDGRLVPGAVDEKTLNTHLDKQ